MNLINIIRELDTISCLGNHLREENTVAEIQALNNYLINGIIALIETSKNDENRKMRHTLENLRLELSDLIRRNKE